MGSLRHHRALALGHRGELDLADVEVAQHLVVDDGDAALPDGAHGQFRLVRHAELADDDDIERRTERGGDLRRDGDTTAGEPEHDGLGPPEAPQGLGELSSGIAAIGEHGAPHSLPSGPR